MEIMMQM